MINPSEKTQEKILTDFYKYEVLNEDANNNNSAQ